ncbi:uncharacterized protein LOC132707669, partial [Cylas formicarius]|uniref:uncharacterized protein LOC132707669 n=1 Tax=Cylas formicarius TaxID=197179 RepID=UPI00295833ED
NKKGVCIGKTKCLLSGGSIIGYCGMLSSCCSHQRSCVKSTQDKVSYFESSEITSDTTHCKYTVKLHNKNVCQVRIDFEKLILAPAKRTVLSTTVNTETYRCEDDILSISPNNYGIPPICGRNNDQHVYVHLSEMDEQVNGVVLEFSLASRESTSLLAPSWKIKVTQLECPRKKSHFDLSKYKDSNEIATDFPLLAPPGAIQYFTERTGVIKSFGYDETLDDSIQQSYPFGEYYGIAFKRSEYVCGIRFNIKYLQLGPKASGTTVAACSQYLFVPDAYSTTVTTTNSQICLGSEGDFFYDVAPGPLEIFVKAIDLDGPITAEKYGFLINYEVQSHNTCPTVS